MTPEAAKEFGLIDDVVAKRIAPDDEKDEKSAATASHLGGK